MKNSSFLFFTFYFLFQFFIVPAEKEVKKESGTNYPKEWWSNYDKSKAPAWEVLPDEAKKGELILSKRNELGILSNFAATPFIYKGKRYESVEGFWQMMKYPESSEDERARFPGIVWKFSREEVSKLTGFEAKKAGSLANDNMGKMKINWVTYEGKKLLFNTEEKGEHYKLIKEALFEKLKQNPEAKKILLSTGDLILKPDHKMGNSPPAWRYNEILMELREEFKKEKK